MKAFARALVTNQLKSLVVCPGASGTHSVLVDLTIHLAAVMLCRNQSIFAPLQQLAMDPANMQVCILSAAFSAGKLAPSFFKANVMFVSVGTGSLLAYHARGHVSSGSTSYGTSTVVL